MAGDDWVEELVVALGEVAAIVTRAGRDVATVVGRVAAGFGLLDTFASLSEGLGAELGAALWGAGAGPNGHGSGHRNGAGNGYRPPPPPALPPADPRPAELPSGALPALPAPTGD
jgi:hypothetical protein